MEMLSEDRLARVIYPMLYWKVFYQLMRAFEESDITRLEGHMHRDTGDIVWFLVKNRFITIDEFNASGRWTLVEEWHIRFFTHLAVELNMSQNGYTRPNDLFPVIENHICKGWLS